jgi:regulator of sigma E protease
LANHIISFLHTTIVFVFVLFIIIIAHEFGHYIFARMLGVRVKEFAIGFGKKLFGKKKGKTDYNVRMVPLGGYVELAGIDPADEENEKDIPDEEKFFSKSALSRFLILFAGPAFNFILALIIFVGTFVFVGIPEPIFTKQAIVGSVINGSAADKAKLDVGDKIIKINNQKINSFEDLSKVISKNPLKALKIEYLRAGKTINSMITPKNQNGIGVIGIVRGIVPIIGEVIPGKPAAIAGIKSGDIISKINDETIYCWDRAVKIINSNTGKAIKMELIRNNKPIDVSITPEYNAEIGAGIIGIGYKQHFIKSHHPIHAMEYAFTNTYHTTKYMVGGLYKLITGKVSVKNISGPIGIASIVRKRADKGFGWLMSIVALLSINIGLLNLFPFPALDGGRLIFIFIELITGYKVSVKVEETIHQIGLYALIFLMIIITYRDIINAFK